jgi:hypothetical protein
MKLHGRFLLSKFNQPERKKMSLYHLLTYLIAAVWFVNGLLCKVLNLVPRHQEIVAEILGGEHAGFLTKTIGFVEIAMAIWIVSGYLPRLNIFVQIIVIATMNVLEFILVPDLLLWGRYNLLIAMLFISIIFYNDFYIKNKIVQQP